MVNFTVDSPIFPGITNYLESIESGLKKISSSTDNLISLQNISTSLQKMAMVPPQQLGLYEWFDENVYGMIMFFILCFLLVAIILLIIACIIWLFLCYPRRQKQKNLDKLTEVKVASINDKALSPSKTDLPKEVQPVLETPEKSQPTAEIMAAKKENKTVLRPPIPLYPETKKEKIAAVNEPFYCPRFPTRELPHEPLEVKTNLPPTLPPSPPTDVPKEVSTPKLELKPAPMTPKQANKPLNDVPIIDGTEPQLLRSDAEIKEIPFRDCVDKRPSAPSSRKQSIRSPTIPPPYPMSNLLVPAVQTTPSAVSSDVSSPKQSTISSSIPSPNAKNKDEIKKTSDSSSSDDEAFQQKVRGNETMPGRNVKGPRKELVV
uniref:Uncharacterized protein n=1 Tax=Panagrolaimus sp. JU765 TaxID=591449 RepID=A0AC34Q652_9BILA